MRLPLTFLFCSFFLAQCVSAQEEILQPISTAVFSDNRAILPFKLTYRRPAFTMGTIVYRNGTQLTAQLNYNLARDEMHFINNDGDTMLVADPLTISIIIINHNRFYYHNDYYLQVIRHSDMLVLAFRQEIIVHLYGHGAPYASNNFF